jgi:hypothetical protein
MFGLELAARKVSTAIILMNALFSLLRYYPFVTAHKKAGTKQYDWLSLIVGGDGKCPKTLPSNDKQPLQTGSCGMKGGYI